MQLHNVDNSRSRCTTATGFLFFVVDAQGAVTEPRQISERNAKRIMFVLLPVFVLPRLQPSLWSSRSINSDALLCSDEKNVCLAGKTRYSGVVAAVFMISMKTGIHRTTESLGRLKRKKLEHEALPRFEVKNVAPTHQRGPGLSFPSTAHQPSSSTLLLGEY